MLPYVPNFLHAVNEPDKLSWRFPWLGRQTSYNMFPERDTYSRGTEMCKYYEIYFNGAKHWCLRHDRSDNFPKLRLNTPNHHHCDHAHLKDRMISRCSDAGLVYMPFL